MTIRTNISWTDHTVNFWTGCKKVSSGCKYCYMYRDQERFKKDPTEVLRVSQSTINNHLREAKPGDKIFTCSFSDFFIEEADQWREWAWDIIRAHPQFVWQILTKRPERIKQCLPADWGDGWDNVWLGVSVENQEAANLRIPILLSIPAKVRWLSCEPLLEAVDISYIPAPDDDDAGASRIHPLTGRRVDMGRPCRETGKIDWVVIGGESGNEIGPYRYRPCEAEWIYNMIIDCLKNDTAVWVKQTGTHLAKAFSCKDRHGADIKEWPSWLQCQHFPTQHI